MISTDVFKHTRSGQDLAVVDNYRVHCDMRRNSTDSIGEEGLLLLNGNGAKTLGLDEHFAVGWERVSTTTVQIVLFRRDASHQVLQGATFESSFAYGLGAELRFIFVLKWPVVECFTAPAGQNSPKTFVGSIALTGEVRDGARLGMEAGLSGVGATLFGGGVTGELALYQLGPEQNNVVQIAASMEVRQKPGEVQLSASMEVKQNSGESTPHSADFKMQRISAVMTSGLEVLTAGVDYDAPASASRAFARIVGVRSSAHGPKDNTTHAKGPEGDGSANILIPDEIVTQIQLGRDLSPGFNLDVELEILEYIGPVGGPNEFIVRRGGVDDDFVIGSSSIFKDVAFTGGVNIGDIVAFLTSIHQTGTETGSFHRQHCSTEVTSLTNVRITRSEVFLGSAMRGSVAVVEFTGSNWRIQRITKDIGGVNPESVAIPTTVVKSRTMLHCQQHIVDASQTEAASNSHEHRGHLAEISADGTTLDYGIASVNGNEQRAVTWLIENLDTGVNTRALVQHKTATEAPGGSAPHAFDVVFGTAVRALDEASVMAEDGFRTLSGAQTWPDGMFDARVTALDTIELETGRLVPLVYQVELVQWPRGLLGVNQTSGSVAVLANGEVQVLGSVSVAQNSKVQIVASVEVKIDRELFTEPFPLGRNDMLIAISGRASRVGQRLRRR